jgi:DNA-binding NarL/FixJ family response regulator
MRACIVKDNLKTLTLASISEQKAAIRVSIVEDDGPVREILAGWLACGEGFQFVSEFGSAEEGLEALCQQKPDVVLMDIKLPGINGVECVRRLKPQLPQTQFVMHTVYEDSNHIFNALQAGATGYLLKQSPHDELLAALKYVHAGGSPMTSYIARRVAQCFPGTPAQTEADDNLSPREREVIVMLARGFLYKEIAEALNISVRTVDTYIRRIYEKLHVRSRAQAVAKYTSFPFADSRSANSR